ncbi:MAG TPA: hypothetical protein VLB74_06700 [Flavobacterium sp.]|uniref:hypothetical protein n=1 Tax=Flavobacterium sp. TaxID=239 RepID=UPI002B692639|nr:hypothetical protein [Flavobacterium sp.]HSD14319.1 hypothetical protein [Flavobacterium sp.]
MKTLKVLFFLAVLLLLFSCDKNEQSNKMIFKMDMVAKKSDSMHIFYKTDGTINFNENESFWVKIKGQNKNQRKTIEFPKGVVPNQVRIDFGRNLEQREIILNKFEFVYFGHSFVAKGKEIYKYFRVDESSTLLDKESGTLKRNDTIVNRGLSLYPNGYYLAVKLEELKFKK